MILRSSRIDWRHADYPAFREEDKPYTFSTWRQPSPEQGDRFLAFMFAQAPLFARYKMEE